MPSFAAGPDYRTPLGRNEYLRSTQDIKTMSWTLAASTVTSLTIDGFPNQKILQPGMVLAKILTGADAGKVGPYQPTTGADVTTATITGSPTGGTFTLTLAAAGQPDTGVYADTGATTAAIAYNATGATVLAAIEALDGVTPGADFTVTGGAGGPYVITAKSTGAFAEVDTKWSATGSLTGGSSPAVGIVDTTPGGATSGATDGRQDAKNIVGINNTFLPWTLEYRDVEVAVVYDAAVYEAFLLMYDHSGNAVAVDDETARALRINKALNILCL